MKKSLGYIKEDPGNYHLPPISARMAFIEDYVIYSTQIMQCICSVEGLFRKEDPMK
jgi:hypothetical protein